MKKYLQIIGVVLAIVIIGSCSSLNSSFYRVLMNSDIISEDFEVHKEFNFDKKLVVATVVIKGKEYEFMFDTGAAISILSQDAAKALNIEEKGANYINDSQGNRQKLGYASIDTLDIGGVLFKDIAVSIIDWPENSAVECIARDGLIGNNLMRHCNWLFDFENKLMTLTDKEIEDEGFTIVPMKDAKSRPRLDIKINEKVLKRVLLDLGSSGGLDISRALAKELSLSPTKFQGKYLLDGSSQGLFGSRMDSVCNLKIDSISFGESDYTFYNASLDIEKDRGAKIGNVLFSQGNLILDYKNEKIGFKSYKNKIVLKDSETFSFSPSLRDSSLLISALLIGGKADLLGIKYGDEIESMNGKKANDFIDYCDYFEFIYSDLRDADSLVLVMSAKPNEEVIFLKTLMWEK